MWFFSASSRRNFCSYHLSIFRGKLRNWSPEFSNFPVIKESRDSSLLIHPSRSREQCTGFILRKHRRFFPPGRHRKIRTGEYGAEEKSASRSCKYYEALHIFINEKPFLAGVIRWRRAIREKTKSLNKQHLAASRTGTWRDIETRAKSKFANTVSSPSHASGRCIRQHFVPMRRGCIERKPRLQSAGRPNRRCDIARYSEICQNCIWILAAVSHVAKSDGWWRDKSPRVRCIRESRALPHRDQARSLQAQSIGSTILW